MAIDKRASTKQPGTRRGDTRGLNTKADRSLLFCSLSHETTIRHSPQVVYELRS